MAQQQPLTEGPSILNTDYLAEWVSHRMQYIIYGLVGFLVILAAVYLLTNRNTKLSEKQYQEASQAFTLFAKPSTEEAEQAKALKDLSALMAKHEDLEATYGGAVAQILINRGNATDAISLAQETLRRTAKDNLPFYHQYAETTLLIVKGKYQDALAQAQQLQQLIEEEIKTIPNWRSRSFGAELFPLNLFRIAMLQKQTGDKAGERATWTLWNQYAGLDGQQTPPLSVDSRIFHAVIQQLAVGTTSLPDYIKERMRDN